MFLLIFQSTIRYSFLNTALMYAFRFRLPCVGVVFLFKWGVKVDC